MGAYSSKKKEIQCLSTETAWIAFHVYNYTHPKILKAEFVEILKTAKLILDFGIDAIDPSMELFNEDCWENTDGIQKGAPPSSAPKNGAPPFRCSPESDLDFHVELYELHIMVCLGRP